MEIFCCNFRRWLLVFLAPQSAHLECVPMKMLAGSSVLWPGIASDGERDHRHNLASGSTQHLLWATRGQKSLWLRRPSPQFIRLIPMELFSKWHFVHLVLFSISAVAVTAQKRFNKPDAGISDRFYNYSI